MVLTSKVAQKSYGTEKRFLCPPPTTMLKGTNWWTSNGSDKPNLTEPKKSNAFFHSPPHLLHPPKLTIHISGEAIQQTGSLEWQSANGTLIEGASSISANLNNAISGRCVSKQLYINDADEKRKRVEVLAKIQLGNGVPLGTFPSKGIKVISKPSKKRQSVKNMELCIHHGTTISLFNRIRSQTVSTKYLGVSNGSQNNASNNGQPNKPSPNNGTCFVARTGSWDPFVIWIVDTSRSPDTTNIPRPNQHHPNNPNFPPPPAIALQTPSSTQQHIAIHYNQPVVLQCVSTGLVSPVMVIRKVDKGSMVLGGNKMDDLSGKTGGECGDETLGDPVSQLHKVAFQIVQDPTFSHHNKAGRYQRPNVSAETAWRIPQSCHPVTYLACLNDVVGMHKTTSTRHLMNGCQTLKVPAEPVSQNNAWSDLIQAPEEEKPTTATKARRRMSSISSASDRRGSIAERRGSSIGDTSGLEGACWTEDVSDAAVWTIVGTDCASYTFWTPESASGTMTPFPVVSHMTVDETTLSLSGENLTRELEVWFGDIKAQTTDYKSRDAISCTIPDTQELMKSPVLEKDEFKCRIPLLFVRGDGVVYRTDQYYAF
ncbi:beta-trefoil [Backusella circina FSU 941]|nr:beta-trefoil [Backusella circina FSU 941]